MCKVYDDLPYVAKIILQIFFGWIIGGVYRIFRFVETHNVVTLVVGILGLVTGIGNAILWVCDLVTEILSNKIRIFAA